MILGVKIKVWYGNKYKARKFFYLTIKNNMTLKKIILVSKIVKTILIFVKNAWNKFIVVSENEFLVYILQFFIILRWYVYLKYSSRCMYIQKFVFIIKNI